MSIFTLPRLWIAEPSGHVCRLSALMRIDASSYQFLLIVIIPTWLPMTSQQTGNYFSCFRQVFHLLLNLFSFNSNRPSQRCFHTDRNKLEKTPLASRVNSPSASMLVLKSRDVTEWLQRIVKCTLQNKHVTNHVIAHKSYFRPSAAKTNQQILCQGKTSWGDPALAWKCFAATSK